MFNYLQCDLLQLVTSDLYYDVMDGCAPGMLYVSL